MGGCGVTGTCILSLFFLCTFTFSVSLGKIGSIIVPERPESPEFHILNASPCLTRRKVYGLSKVSSPWKKEIFPLLA